MHSKEAMTNIITAMPGLDKTEVLQFNVQCSQISLGPELCRIWNNRIGDNIQVDTRIEWSNTIVVGQHQMHTRMHSMIFL